MRRADPTSDDWWMAVPKGLPPGYRLSSLAINGEPVSGTTAHHIANALIDAAAIAAMLRELYGHHLPKRLRKK